MELSNEWPPPGAVPIASTSNTISVRAAATAPVLARRKVVKRDVFEAERDFKESGEQLRDVLAGRVAKRQRG